MKIYNIYQKQVKQYSIDGINWINTLEYRPSVLLASGLESCDEYEPPTPPFAESLDNLGINDLTSCESSLNLQT